MNRESLDFGIDEHLAYCENRHRDLLKRIESRIMTRDEYKRVSRFLKEFFWRIKQRQINKISKSTLEVAGHRQCPV
ncbi:MAG TPA: hypothetical protein ENH82_13610 [bacterium]|nr:hypothetical protein [bacterium]